MSCFNVRIFFVVWIAMFLSTSARAGFTCEPDNIKQLHSVTEGLTGLVEKSRERQAELLCLRSICTVPVGIETSVHWGSSTSKTEQLAEVARILRQHDENKWKDLAESDRLWRQKLGAFPAGEKLEGASAIVANARLLGSFAEMVSTEQNPVAGTVSKSAPIRSLLRRFSKLTAPEKKQIVENFSTLSSIEKEEYARPEVQSAFGSTRALEALWKSHKAALEKFKKDRPDAYNSMSEFDTMRDDNPDVIALGKPTQLPTRLESDRVIWQIAHARVWMRIFSSVELSKSFSQVPSLDKFISASRFASTKLPSLVPNSIGNERKNCRKDVEAAFWFSPTEIDVSRARAQVEEARKRALDFWSGRFSPQTSNAMSQRIKSAKIEFPPTRESFAANVGSRARDSSSESQFRTASYKKSLDGQIRPNLVAEGYDLSWYDSAKQGRMVVLCDDQGFNTTSFAEAIPNRIQMSAEATRFADRTPATAAHEFNHISDPNLADDSGIVISAHSRGVRKSVADCLEAQHGADLPRRDSYSSIEDFADLFLPGNAPGCDLMKSSDGTFYRGSGFDKDRHSPSMFVLLHSAFRSARRLTAECSDYVVKFKPWKFRDCLAIDLKVEK